MKKIFTHLPFNGIYLKTRMLLLLAFIFMFCNINATDWNGNLDASYNPCDGSITFTCFLYQNGGTGHDDKCLGNMVIQYKDNNGVYQRLLILRYTRAMDASGNRIPSWDNSSNWRGNNGQIITIPNNNVSSNYKDSRFLFPTINDNNGWVYTTSDSFAICSPSGCGSTTNRTNYARSSSEPEPQIELSTYSEGDRSTISIKWKNPPQYIKSSNSFYYKMPFAQTVNNAGGLYDFTGLGNMVPSYSNSINIQQLKSVSSMIVSKSDYCNKIELHWPEVQDYCNGAHYRIYRDNQQIASPLIFQNNNLLDSFVDNNPIKGIEHQYKLQVVHYSSESTPSSPATFPGPMSASYIGKVKSAPVAPEGLTATDNKCNGTVDLTWGVNNSTLNATPHTAFRLERSTDTSFLPLTTFDNIDKGARSFTDTSVVKNVKYYYRLRAKNGCSNNSYDISSPSNVISGGAPGDPPKVARITVDTLPFNKILITWNDSTAYEDHYIVSRSLFNGGGATDFTVDKNTTSYVDSLAKICTDYVYKIKSTNVCNTNGIESQVLGQIRLDAKLGQTFDIASNKILKASKGYYPNRIELNWSNNNASSITTWKIYRKNINSTADSVLIASPTSTTGQYIDYTADANVFYKYSIVGEAICGLATLYSNISEDIGFRYPSGSISGSIQYEGGIAVKNVKVIAEPSSGNSGYSMNFDGSSNGATILSSPSINSGGDYTIELWTKINDSTKNDTLIQKADNSGNIQYSLEFNASDKKIHFITKNGTVIKEVKSIQTVISSYTHITAVKSGSTIKLYLNENLQDSLNSVTVPSFNSNVVLGKSLNGTIDELRIYKNAKSDEQVKQDYNRYINPVDNNLVAYFSFDENNTLFKKSFDLSKSNGQFNENILTYNQGVSYSDIIPTNAQLNNIAYTDSNGFYIINACRYTGNGQNFNITPVKGTHAFNPSNKIQFVGEGSTLISNIDFVDKSSFVFNGNVKYANCTCPMEGAMLYIDDAVVFKAGEIAKSDANGNFSIRVPIGEHFVSVKYPYHTMSVGRYPLTNGTLYNFQADVDGIAQFIDTTLRKVIGRVVGGQVEAKKAEGLGRSINNVGKANIVFKSMIGDGCIKDTITTNDTTGEYSVMLPPIKYTIDNIKIPTNLGLNFTSGGEGIGKIIDLTFANEEKVIIDTLYREIIDNTGKKVKQLVSVDSVKYHNIFSNTIRNNVTINMKGKYETNSITKDSFFIGEPYLTIDTAIINLIPYSYSNIDSNIITYPVFKKENTYNAKFECTENFINNDYTIPKVFKYPVSGVLNIASYVGTNSGSFNVDETGIYNWSFIGGVPNLELNNLTPQYNFTNTIQIVFNSPGTATVEYLPFKSDPVSKLYRAYVLGGRGHGSNFVTKDISKVEFVLRDPPGTNSFATWLKGSSNSKKTYSSTDDSYGGGASVEVKAGLSSESSAGAGVGAIFLTQIEENSNKASLGASVNIMYQDVSSSAKTEIKENTETISTSASDDQVGHNADVFIGFGKNLVYGTSLNLIFVDSNQCNLEGITCSEKRVGKYVLAKKSKLSVGNSLATTKFHYTTQEIEEIVIPNLESLRNALFTESSGAYVSHATINDDPGKFGSNNDDPIWGSNVSDNKPFEDNVNDSTGSSYTFYSYKNTVSADSIYTIDSLGVKTWIATPSVDKVRDFNKAIRMWKIELAKNEREKYNAFKDGGGTGIDNISVGTATIQKTMTSIMDKEWVEEYNFHVSNEIKLGLERGSSIGKVALETESSLSFNNEHHWTNGSQENSVTTNTYDYVFQDENQGDLLNLLVMNPKDGGGHIFKVLAGQTTCPYQDELKAKWYDKTKDSDDKFHYIFSSTQPLDAGEILSEATVKIQDPKIVISQNKLFNVPADEKASFNMVLSNNSATSTPGPQDFDLRIDLASNPFGAIVKVDGLDPNRTFTRLDNGVGYNKVLTVERGPEKFDYDSIMVIFTTNCEVDKEFIADTAYISVHFIPTCTKADLFTPDNQWVANNFVGDTLPIVINNYNYNYVGFDNIKLKYKKSSETNWITQETFYLDTTGFNDPTAKLIPQNRDYIDYKWSINDVVDGPYDIKLDVNCKFDLYGTITKEIPKKSGIIDKINPTPFGTPSPGDGILDPNDDISIQFNEPLDNGTLSFANFDVRGVLNGSTIRNSNSLYLNGVSDYIEIPGDVNLKQRDFTIDMWVKRDALNTKQTLVSQGIDANQSFEFGFDADNKLYYRVNSETIKSDIALNNISDFHHIALTYNNTNEIANMYMDGALVNSSSNNLYSDVLASGKLNIGKNLSGNNQYFSGNLHEIRVWNTYRTLAQIAVTMNKTVNRSVPGTLFNWRLDEATGKEAKDEIRERNGIINGCTWMVTPSGSSASFNGVDQLLKIKSSDIAINKEMDMTLEFWFNSSQTSEATLFSNGKGMNSIDSLYAWNVSKDASGNIHVINNNNDWTAVSKNYFDGQWHHFAMIMDRSTNTIAYIDGVQQNTTPTSKFAEFGSSQMYLGALLSYNGSLFDSSNFYNGSIDEFRFWNSARKYEQVLRDKNNRLTGKEYGLVSYIPFEKYVEVAGIPMLNNMFLDVVDSTHTITNINNVSFSTSTPTIKLPRPISSIPFTFLLNNDKIIITPNVPAKDIENVTLDITTKGVKDKNGNIQQSPKTWIAYINKNQIVWGNDAFSFDKKLNAPLTFSSSVVNQGGATKEFTIDNLPTWLTASPTSGTIAPNTVLPVTFTVNPGMAIGDFEQDIQLLTDFGFPEKLNVKVKCRKDNPTWSVDASKFQYSMNIIGKLKINEVLSTDIEDKIAVFVGDECRGVANVRYVPQFDDYFVFLDLYSNSPTGDELFESKVWDASVGAIFRHVTPDIKYESNTVLGSMSSPIIFRTDDNFDQIIPLVAGWNWISTNMMLGIWDLNEAMSSLKSTFNDELKSQTSHSLFTSEKTWVGNIDHIKENKGYMLRSSKVDTLIFVGTLAHPLAPTSTINLTNGWNWIGFNSIRNLSLNTALGSLTPNDEDLIKGKNNFAVYNQNVGWIGSLTTLEPGQGYMYKTKKDKSFNYPIAGYYKSGEDNTDNLLIERFNIKANSYQSNMNLLSTLSCNESIDYSNLYLLAFDQYDACKGAVKFDNKNTVYKNRAFLTLAGNDDDKLKLKVYNDLSDNITELNETVTYISNELIGSLHEPYNIKLSEAKCTELQKLSTEKMPQNNIVAYPTEFSDEIKIKIKNVTKEDIKVDFSNLLGQSLVSTSIAYDASNTEIKMSKLIADLNNLAKGIYFLNVSIGSYTQSFKLIK